jgi:hypothetical protein
VLREYADHYNRHRPHRGLELRVPERSAQPEGPSHAGRPHASVARRQGSAESSANTRWRREAAEFVYPTGSKPVYLELTALVADPPRLLRTVMFCGFVGHEN